MTGGDVAALIASVLSMAVGVGAIVLSFVLYRWSAKTREEAKDMSINTQNTIDHMKEQWGSGVTSSFVIWELGAASTLCIRRRRREAGA